MPKLRINLNRNFASFASFANFASFASFASFGSFASSGSFAISQFRSFDTIQWVSPFGIRPNRFRQATLMVQQLSSQENGTKIILIGMLEVKDVNGMKAKKHYIIILIFLRNIKIIMIPMKNKKIGAV